MASRNETQLKRMLKLEERARILASKLAEVQVKWEETRDVPFLQSLAYRLHCQKNGIAECYKFGDVIC